LTQFDGPPQKSAILPRRPIFPQQVIGSKEAATMIITALHGRHRGQERPVIDALRLDQRLALQQSF
jgi:hypothetical protein